jgi:hypothetical protein
MPLELFLMLIVDVLAEDIFEYSNSEDWTWLKTILTGSNHLNSPHLQSDSQSHLPIMERNWFLFFFLSHQLKPKNP